MGIYWIKHKIIYGVVHLVTTKSIQWQCCTATAAKSPRSKLLLLFFAILQTSQLFHILLYYTCFDLLNQPNARLRASQTHEGDWGCLNLEEAKIDQENKDQEWDEWDEQGYVMEGEELDDIYGDDELEELEGEELKASLKLAMENQLKRVG
jgi:hypothetical protein